MVPSARTGGSADISSSRMASRSALAPRPAGLGPVSSVPKACTRPVSDEIANHACSGSSSIGAAGRGEDDAIVVLCRELRDALPLEAKLPTAAPATAAAALVPVLHEMLSSSSPSTSIASSRLPPPSAVAMPGDPEVEMMPELPPPPSLASALPAGADRCLRVKLAAPKREAKPSRERSRFMARARSALRASKPRASPAPLPSSVPEPACPLGLSPPLPCVFQPL